MKILFLDIDGVLNSADNMNSMHVVKAPNYRDEFGHTFDQRCVNWLHYIHEQTQCNYVISSTWRLSGLEVMQRLFWQREIKGEIIAVTPQRLPISYINQLGLERACRGAEIQYWLDNNLVQNYCIVDDDSDMLPSQKEHFVQTQNRFGLTKETAFEIIKILNKP